MIPVSIIACPTISESYAEEAMPSASPSGILFERDGASANRVLRCAWTDAISIVAQMMPWVGNVGTTGLVYHPGQPYPHQWITGRADYGMRVASVGVEPLGKSSQGAAAEEIAYEHARLLVHYEVVQGNIWDLFEETAEPAVEFITLPNRKLYWAAARAGPLVDDESPGRLIQTIDWGYTIKMMPFIPPNTFVHQGLVNAAAMTSPEHGLTFPIGTVLYNAPEIRPFYDFAGYRRYDVTFRFTARLEGDKQHTWNKGYRAGKSGADGLQTIYDEDGVEWRQYSTADLNDFMLTEA